MKLRCYRKILRVSHKDHDVTMFSYGITETTDDTKREHLSCECSGPNVFPVPDISGDPDVPSAPG